MAGEDTDSPPLSPMVWNIVRELYQKQRYRCSLFRLSCNTIAGNEAAHARTLRPEGWSQVFSKAKVLDVRHEQWHNVSTRTVA